MMGEFGFGINPSKTYEGGVGHPFAGATLTEYGLAFSPKQQERYSPCPGPVHETLAGFSRYRTTLASLPRSEQEKLRCLAILIRTSRGSTQGCLPIQTVRLIGHADRDPVRESREPGFMLKISQQRAAEMKLALQVLIANPAIDRANPQFQPRLHVVTEIAPNEAQLDGMNRVDAAILSTGIHQWSAHADPELSGLLQRFKDANPAEFDLYFGIYRLDVRRVRPFDFILRERTLNQRRRAPGEDIAAVDLPRSPLTRRAAFFGETRVGAVTLRDTPWPARFREATIASVAFRAGQIREATARFDRILRNVPQLVVTINRVQQTLPLNQIITSQRGAALILDQHINLPGFVRADLQNAANQAGSQPNLAALDAAITAPYTTIRRTADTPGRNRIILNNPRLSTAHGSFTGW